MPPCRNGPHAARVFVFFFYHSASGPLIITAALAVGPLLHWLQDAVAPLEALQPLALGPVKHQAKPPLTMTAASSSSGHSATDPYYRVRGRSVLGPHPLLLRL